MAYIMEGGEIVECVWPLPVRQDPEIPVKTLRGLFWHLVARRHAQVPIGMPSLILVMNANRDEGLVPGPL
jgi:hypothetical protein